jgi:hypothetical protein
MGERQQEFGLALRLFGRLEYLAPHRAPGFMMPNKIDRLLTAIVDNSEDSKVRTDPRTDFYLGISLRHQVTTI